MLVKKVLYKKDVNVLLYEVINEDETTVTIRGVNYRRILRVNKSEIVSAPDDLIKKEEEVNKFYNKLYFRGSTIKRKVGMVVHFDSDSNYLEKCCDLYKKMGVYCYPILTKEENITNKINDEDFGFVPDVVVLTGHDLFIGGDKKELDSYTNSIYFVSGVRATRKKYPSSVIIAGACQSNFEALIANGANFASSPKRINVHIYDPVIIAVFVAVTSFRKIVNFDEIEKHIDSIRESFGGIETFGKMKMLY